MVERSVVERAGKTADDMREIEPIDVLGYAAASPYENALSKPETR
mgnify:CR=1 FL=1